MIWLVLISFLLVGCMDRAECKKVVQETLTQEENYKRLHSETMSAADFERWGTLLNLCRGGL